jgi:hypothetical protein
MVARGTQDNWECRHHFLFSRNLVMMCRRVVVVVL